MQEYFFLRNIMIGAGALLAVLFILGVAVCEFSGRVRAYFVRKRLGKALSRRKR